jgi:hypothetical protein
VWTLIILVTVEYAWLATSLGKKGEGGTIVLRELLVPLLKTGRQAGFISILTFIGISLLIGDGVITPAISLLSAVEGMLLIPGLENTNQTILIIIAAAILTFAVINRNKNDEQIKVTGLGEKDFQSDLIVWNGTFSQTGAALKEAYEKLNNDQEKIKLFLANKGINEKEIIYSAVNISKEFEEIEDRNGNRIQKQIGYRLQQNVKIESNDIGKIEKVSREITELINNGVEFYSQEPQYYFTKLNDLKIELIELATKNGKERAEKIAEKSGFIEGSLSSRPHSAHFFPMVIC